MIGNRRGVSAGTVAFVATIAAGPAYAQSSSVSADQIDKLQAQIQALEHEMQQLKGKVAAEKAYAAPPTQPLTKAPTLPTAIVKMSPGNRPSICSVDGLNCISLYGRVQVDAGGYNYHPNSASTSPQNLDNGVNARRAQRRSARNGQPGLRVSPATRNDSGSRPTQS